MKKGRPKPPHDPAPLVWRGCGGDDAAIVCPFNWSGDMRLALMVSLVFAGLALVGILSTSYAQRGTEAAIEVLVTQDVGVQTRTLLQATLLATLDNLDATVSMFATPVAALEPAIPAGAAQAPDNPRRIEQAALIFLVVSVITVYALARLRGADPGRLVMFVLILNLIVWVVIVINGLR
jgi:hypothetical protein